ncbi:MAG: ABC transporter permease [Armatimonadetes bacterium]|nr:ABC transporter permease [Armatimonadota bacterium]
MGWVEGFYRAGNLRDLLVKNLLVLLPAIGMTLVIVARQIDISIGSQFAICGVAAGLLAKAGVPPLLLLLLIPLLGGLLGAWNGWLVAWVRIPSIIVTLGMMVAWRAAIRWTTQGAWVENLPAGFQWFGLGQAAGQALIVTLALAVFACGVWATRNLAAGRAVYAVGADAEAARLAGIRPRNTVFGTFVVLGMLTGLAALLHSIRFVQVQSNSGLGLELTVIAAVVVGGTSILGGRGTLVGALLGVMLLGTIGTVLTFLGIDAAWEKALQGVVVLGAVALDGLGARGEAGGGDG